MNIFQIIRIGFRKWIDKQKSDRDKVDKMMKTHENKKDEQQNSPAGFEATEVYRKSYSGSVG